MGEGMRHPPSKDGTCRSKRAQMRTKKGAVEAQARCSREHRDESFGGVKDESKGGVVTTGDMSSF